MKRNYYSILTFVLICMLFEVYCGSLNMQIKGHDMECVYMQKDKGDNIECYVSVSSDSGMVDFTIFKPNSEVLLEQKRLMEHAVGPTTVDDAGDYMFCFHNSYSRQSTIVSFEYDLGLDLDSENEGSVKKRVNKEKKNFLIKTVNKMKENKRGRGEDDKNLNYEQKQHELWDMLKNNIKSGHEENQEENQQDETIKKQLLLLSLYFDRIESYLDMHKNRVRRHHYLQMSNNSNVMFFSIFISISIVIAAMVQLIILKGFFNGKMSWKVWKF